MDTVLIGLIVYLVVIFTISIFHAKKIKGSSKNFILAGGTLSFVFVLFAQMEQAVDGNATLGVFNLTRDFGFWSAMTIPIGLGLSLILAGIFFAKPLRELKLITISDFFRIKFGEKIEVIASILMVISFAVLLGGNLSAVAIILGKMFGLSFFYSVLISFLFIFIYTYLGGFYSDVVTDPIQVLTFFIGILGALALIIINYGTSIFAHASSYSLTQFTLAQNGAVINWATIIALGLGDIIAVDFINRILSAKKTSYAQKGAIIGGIGTIIIGALFALFGVASLSLTNGNQDIFTILSSNFPFMISVLVLGAIITASLSTADGALLGPATLIAKNILHKDTRKITGMDPLLKYTRFYIIIVGLIGVVIALRIPQPGILLTLAFDVVLCSLFACFVFGTFWIADKTAATASIIVGGLLRLTFFILTPTIFGVPNTLIYVKNTYFNEMFDGWATIIPFVISMLVYFILAKLMGIKNSKEVSANAL